MIILFYLVYHWIVDRYWVHSVQRNFGLTETLDLMVDKVATSLWSFHFTKIFFTQDKQRFTSRYNMHTYLFTSTVLLLSNC